MDGVDDYAVVQPFGNLNLGMQNFTLEATVMLRSKRNVSDEHVILSNYHQMQGYIFGVNVDGTLFLTINNSTYSENIPFNGTGVADANCHSVAAKREDEWVYFYVDGQLTTSMHVGPIQDVSTPSNIYIGINTDLNSHTAFYGMLDDVRIWDIARPDVDISMNSSSCLSGSETGLVAQWRFDHLEEPVIYDFSTNLHSGSLVSGGSNIGPQYLPFYCGMVCDDMDIRVTAAPNCTQNNNPVYCTQRNLICNCNFEQGAQIPGTNQNSFGNCSASGSSNEVTNWCSLFGTAWYFGRTGVPSNSIPTNRIVGGINPRSIQWTYLKIGDNKNISSETSINGLIVKNIINLKQELEIRKLVPLELYNVNGQIVSDKNLNYNIKDGLYMLRVREAEGAIKSLKVIFNSAK